MYILWALLWWATISHATFKPGRSPVCLDKKAWKMPATWHLPTNNYIQLFNEDNRPWRQPLMKEFIQERTIPGDIVLSNPLLPTTDKDNLELYSEAIRVLAEDEATSVQDKLNAEDAFQQDTACWNLEMECQNGAWMLSWPWWSCSGYMKKVTAGWFNWHTGNARDLDALTKSLLKRAYRYALLDLGRNLTREITHIGYYPLSKRTPSFETGPVPELVIPKYAIHIESLIKFYTDPVHRAEHHAVREPHLPGYVVPPTPLLSIVIFNRTDKALVNLYRDALRAYDEEHQLDDDQIRQRWEQHLEDSWHWIVTDPCYYSSTDCNQTDYLARIFGLAWFETHLNEGSGFKKAMEHKGLADLGTKLILEALTNKGSRRDLQRLLSEFWDDDGLIWENDGIVVTE